MSTDLDMPPFKVRHRRKETSFGQNEVFTAILPTGRIVGQVEIQIPLEPGFAIDDRSGPEVAKQIRDAAAQLVFLIAHVVEKPRGEK